MESHPAEKKTLTLDNKAMKLLGTKGVSDFSSQGLTLSFFRYLSKGQVNLYFTCPRAQVTCPNTKFLYKHYILVQMTNVIAIDLIIMYPLFKKYSLNI